MESITKISTKNMSGTEWRQARKASIGGSDAAAILRLSDYSSPYTVWAEKTGRIPEKEDNEAMRQGRDLEQYVADRFCEQTGKKVRRVNAIIKNDRYPFAHANIDRAVIGEHAGLECKTTSVLNLRKFANGEYPANYYVQCVHYMAVTGAEKWYLAVLVLGRDFLVYEIPRDDDEIAALMQSESEFWELVKCNTPPAADGSKSTTDTILHRCQEPQEAHRSRNCRTRKSTEITARGLRDRNDGNCKSYLEGAIPEHIRRKTIS